MLASSDKDDIRDLIREELDRFANKIDKVLSSNQNRSRTPAHPGQSEQARKTYYQNREKSWDQTTSLYHRLCLNCPPLL